MSSHPPARACNLQAREEDQRKDCQIGELTTLQKDGGLSGPHIGIVVWGGAKSFPKIPEVQNSWKNLPIFKCWQIIYFYYLALYMFTRQHTEVATSGQKPEVEAPPQLQKALAIML